MSDYKLVYTDDPKLSKKCNKCNEYISECTCNNIVPVNVNSIISKLRIEKSGRNGKTVSIIDNLPANQDFLKDLCTLLKKKCGAGGTHLIKENKGQVEIQGDKLSLIREILTAKNIKYKG